MAVWATAAELQANLAPSATVVNLLDTVKGIKKPEPDNNIFLTPDEEKRNVELGRKANSFLDLQYIGAYALSNYWTARSASDRKAFVTLFGELLQKIAFTNTSKFLGDLEVKVGKEKVLKDKAMVYTSIDHEKEGRVDIDFKLHQADNGAWVVEDVLLDGVSLVRNLRTQCLKIIRENSFEELMGRMRKRIVELDSSDIKDITGKD
jgi:phospholipid transport system substrate-binding protein